MVCVFGFINFFILFWGEAPVSEQFDLPSCPVGLLYLFILFDSSNDKILLLGVIRCALMCTNVFKALLITVTGEGQLRVRSEDGVRSTESGWRRRA